MSSQQSLHKMIKYFLGRNLSLRNRWSQISVVCVWIFCLVSAEGPLVVAAPCNGNKGDNCSSDCNVSCIAIACISGTGECKNSTADAQVPNTDKEENVQPVPVLKCELGAEECSNNTSEVAIPPDPSTDEEEIAQPAPMLECEQGTEECKNNTTEAAIPSFANSDISEEDTSQERMQECDDELGGFGDCENITTEGDIPTSADEKENGPVTPMVPAPKCPDGLYGVNCSIACPANCVTPRCGHVTGDCSSGCKIGYQGPRCAETCPTGYYGHECKNSCPANCATIDCHHEHGYCLDGCKEDYWGSDCSLLFKNNGETEQDKFYVHLSAESKSVLLYVLMSKYEETLERAQLEVNRSLRLRNKLRAIMGT